MTISEKYHQTLAEAQEQLQWKNQRAFDKNILLKFKTELSKMLDRLGLDSISYCYSMGEHWLDLYSPVYGKLTFRPENNWSNDENRFAVKNKLVIYKHQKQYLKFVCKEDADTEDECYVYDLRISDIANDILSGILDGDDSLIFIEDFIIKKD